MKRVLLVVLALMIMSLGTSIVSAQTPNVQVFFDEWFGATHLDQCPPDTPGTVNGYLYVVASNFGMWMTAIEYAIVYPPEITYIGDITTGLSIGKSPSYAIFPETTGGIATSWPFAINAYFPVLVNKVFITFNCQLCYDTDIPITVVAHPGTGFLRAVRYPDGGYVSGVGMLSYICPTVPAEETTWGNIKALYN